MMQDSKKLILSYSFKLDILSQELDFTSNVFLVDPLEYSLEEFLLKFYEIAIFFRDSFICRKPFVILRKSKVNSKCLPFSLLSNLHFIYV